MHRALKWALYTLGALALMVAIAALAANFAAERKLARVVKVDVKAIALPADTSALANGRYLFESRGCSECHGADGRGKVVIDATNGLYVKSPAINPAAAATAKYSTEDWIRTIRHGVKPDGRPLLVMPSQDYNRLSDPDAAALIAYARSLPATQGEGAVIRLPLPVKALYAAGIVRDAAEVIDHALPPASPVAAGATVEHGRYVANMCIGCHGPTLSGGRIPGAPPEWPPASNLTPGEGTAMARYDRADKLRAMMRSGKRPDGSAVSTVMPFESLRALNDVDVDALYLYLKTLPPRAAGGR
jgi:mono/diheme cytochrome c family protein